jgi:hypothetical protein
MLPEPLFIVGLIVGLIVEFVTIVGSEFVIVNTDEEAVALEFI